MFFAVYKYINVLLWFKWLTTWIIGYHNIIIVTPIKIIRFYRLLIFKLTRSFESIKCLTLQLLKLSGNESIQVLVRLIPYSYICIQILVNFFCIRLTIAIQIDAIYYFQLLIEPWANCQILYDISDWAIKVIDEKCVFFSYFPRILSI